MKEDDDFVDIEELPIFKKGQEIFDLVNRIGELIPDEDESLQFIKGFMISDAAQLTVKIIGAHHAQFYDIKMEAACIVRKAAKDLCIHYQALKMFGFDEFEYYQLVLELVDDYRLLFIDWVKDFDQWDYTIDRWGLFNPPGVSPFDHDPDDDIPFDPEDEFPFEE